MNFIIPMAGKGQRFVDAGYDLPKMLIEAKGKTLLEWSVDSLPLELSSRLIFILLKEHADKYQLDEFILQKYSVFNPIFYYLEEVTKGQAETVLKSHHLWDLEQDILIFNIDTAFHSDSLKEVLLHSKKDGVLGAFIDESGTDKYSFAALNAEGEIFQVVEKERISDFALTGLYHFTNPMDFIELATDNIKNNRTVKSEFYIAPIYNQLIEKGKDFVLDVCTGIDILGTPEELNVFLKK